jgi:hypothetical protein
MYKKGKAIPVTGRGDPFGYETSRLPHFLDQRFSNFFEVETTFIIHNSSVDHLALVPFPFIQTLYLVMNTNYETPQYALL